MVLKPGQAAVLADLPVPTATPGSLVVEMRACGLCGSDLEKIRGAYTAAPPVIGHEAVGVVAHAGSGAAGIRPGDRVFPHHHVACGECRECQAGSPTMCARYRATNLEPGGFAEHFRVPAWNVTHGGVLKLPDSVTFEQGTFIEPVACVLRGLHRAPAVRDGDALIAGAGPTGLVFLQLLRHLGASKVFVSEVSAYRRGFADDLGADGTWDPRAVEVSEAVRSRTASRGVDLAVVATGHADALGQALRSVRAGGTVLLFGVPEVGSRLDFDVSQLVTREVSIVPSNAATEEATREALELIRSKKIDVDRLVTHRFRLGQFHEAAAIASRAECVKAIVTP